jgi:sugar/nucleoside kinase (ribokinase family)
MRTTRLSVLGRIPPNISLGPCTRVSRGSTRGLCESATIGSYLAQHAATVKSMSIPSAANVDIRHKLLADTDLFLFDCDGVLWRGKVAIDRSKETIDYHRKKNNKVAFDTNTTQSRAELKEKFSSFGIDVNTDGMYPRFV